MGDFTATLDKFAKTTPAQARTIRRKVCIDLLRRIVQATPVGNPDLWKSPAPAGYVGGRLRGNWNTGLGAINYDVQAPAKAGGAPIARGISTLQRTRDSDADVYITNSLPYAIPVEYGHSWKQAPAGMVRTTIASFNGIVQDAARSTK